VFSGRCLRRSELREVPATFSPGLSPPRKNPTNPTFPLEIIGCDGVADVGFPKTTRQPPDISGPKPDIFRAGRLFWHAQDEMPEPVSPCVSLDFRAERSCPDNHLRPRSKLVLCGLSKTDSIFRVHPYHHRDAESLSARADKSQPRTRQVAYSWRLPRAC